MKTLLQLIAVSLVLSSCSSLQKTGQNSIGTYDDVYYTPSDEEAIAKADSKPTPVEATPEYETATPAEPDYRKYKEGEPEEIVREPESSDRNENYNYSAEEDYYDDETDFSYGRSLRRLRYGDGYRDGYRDATYDNSYSGGYYNSYYNDPYWGWNRPARTRFWVGFNTWGGWSVGYNYGYPAWGWRTSYYPCYNNFYDPWYGYPGCWGYYSNVYYGGTPYGYYDPFYSPYFGGYYGGSGWRGNNYNRPWYNGGNVGYRNDKTRMTGPRETIGSNSPSSTRKDQVSPRSRGGMVQKETKDGGTTYDPKKGNQPGIVEKGRTTSAPGNVTENKGRVSSGSPTSPDNGTAGRKSTPDAGNSGKITAPDNVTVTPGNSGGSPRGRVKIIDRSTPDYGNSNETPSRGNEPVREYDRGYKSGGTPGSRGRATETRDNRTRSYESENNSGRYEQPREERKTRTRTEPSENRSRRNDQPSNSTPQHRDEPRNNTTPRTYDSGGGSRGGSNSPSPGGGNSGGSSTPSSRGRGR